MSERRLSLRRESLTELQTDELTSVVGAISAPHLLCVTTSVQYSQCYSCGIACTTQCPTN
jgi:ferredoxin